MKLSPLSVVVACGLLFAASPAVAQQAVLVTVNDHPVTDFDITQRIKLLNLLGERNPIKLERKAVANALIDDYIKIDTARLYKADPTDRELDERLHGMAQGMKTDDAGLKAKLGEAGLTVGTLRQYADAQMSFTRILQGKYHEKPQVDQAAVDKKFAQVKADIQGKVAKIEADPRRQPIKVIELQEINFPVDGADPQVLQSRALEAGQAAQKLSSCSGIKSAISGIFNVQIGKKIEADARKLPAPLQAQLAQRGIGHAIGPMRYAKGIQLLAYCGGRTVTPPPLKYELPTRDQIQSLALNEKFDQIEQKYMVIMRKDAIIEYKDQSLAQ